MNDEFPSDADGEALRQVAEIGADMSKPMKIDFMIAVPDEISGQSIARLAQEIGYETDVEQDDETGEYTCYCSKIMIADYAAVISVQNELDRLAKPFNGCADGWGTFGNVSKEQSE